MPDSNELTLKRTFMKTLHYTQPLRFFRGSLCLLVLPLMLSAFMLTSCAVDNPTGNDAEAAMHFDQIMNESAPVMLLSESTADLLKEVKKSTARFNSTTQAIRAGYAPTDHCVEHPELGGMGYHWVNGPLVDPYFDPLKPEAILYETHKNGSFRIIGVEYIVINVGQDQPYFGDYPFDVGGTPIEADHWSLHVWLYKDNPAGMFTPFNPNVSCP